MFIASDHLVAHRQADQRGSAQFPSEGPLAGRRFNHQQAGGLAAGAVEILFHRATASSARKGERLERYFRDVTMYRSHVSAQQIDFAVRNAAFYLGAADDWIV